MVCPFCTLGPVPLTIGVTTSLVSAALPPAVTAGSLARAAGVFTAAGAGWEGAGPGGAGSEGAAPGRGAPPGAGAGWEGAGREGAGSEGAAADGAAATGAEAAGDLSGLWALTAMKTMTRMTTMATPATAPPRAWRRRWAVSPGPFGAVWVLICRELSKINARGKFGGGTRSRAQPDRTTSPNR